MATAVILAFSQTSLAYDFSIPKTPSLPTQLPSQTQNIDDSTSANSGTTNPASNWDWYGPLTNSLTNNDVHVTKLADRDVFGGWSINDAETVSSNRVVIEKDGSMKHVYGGYSRTGKTENNIVEVFGSTVQGDIPAIYGGYSKDKGDTIKNMVFIHDGATVNANVIGGKSENGKAEGNILVIEKSAQVESSGITGGSGVSTFGNSVFIYGTVSGGNWITGGQADDGQESDNNLVYVGPGAKIQQSVFASRVAVGTASNNILIIDSAHVGGNAGAVDAAKLTSWTTADYTQGTGNELHLLGNAVIEGGAGAHFDGAQLNGGRGYNSLVHINGTITVGGLSSFDQLIVELTDENVETAALTITNAHEVIYEEDPILDLTSVATIISGDELTDPAKGAVLISVSPEGEAKESLTLIVDDKTSFSDETSVFVDQTWTVSEEIVANKGIEIDKMYINSDGELVTSLNETETVLGEKTVTASSESHTLSESFLGTVAFVNQGAEFIADEGMRAMVDAAEVGKVSVFGAIHGGTSRYETGSHVDVDGVTLATGAVTKVGSLMLAGFVEAGWASSESHVSGTKGDGDHDYYGFGAALRYSFENPFYIDGSARFGWASTEFNGRYADASAKYDADSFYGSMHIGAGYVFGLTEKTDLDVYGRYVLTYLEGDTTGLGTPDGETFDMDDTMTHAFRVGARLTGEINESAGWGFGFAYEHVADGDAESDVVASGTRASLDVPTLEGDTGIVEAGITVRPNGTSPWSANIGIKGYVGDREGVSGSASIVYSF